MTTTEETTAMASIEDYQAEQASMERLRAKHVTNAFTAETGDGWTSAQVSALVGGLDLGRFVTADGDVDTARVRALVASLNSAGSSTAQKGPTADSGSRGSDLYDRVHGQPGDGGRAAAQRRGFGAKS